MDEYTALASKLNGPNSELQQYLVYITSDITIDSFTYCQHYVISERIGIAVNGAFSIINIFPISKGVNKVSSQRDL